MAQRGKFSCPAAPVHLIAEGYDTAMKILTKNKSNLVKLAEKLIAQETLEGEELEKVFRELSLPRRTREVKKTTIPAPIKPVGEAEPAKKPKEVPGMPRLIPKQTPATPD